MKIIYIAGPYIGDGRYLTVDSNIRKAEAFAIKLVEKGIGFFCPHLNSAHFQIKTERKQDYWYLMDLCILERCDAVAFSPDCGASTGCKIEMTFAKNHDIPILYWNDLEKWAKDYQ